MSLAHLPGAEVVAQRMTPAELRDQANEIRELMRSVLEEGVDFGRIPNTPKPTLFKSGAEWLLKWARFGHRMVRVEVERDDNGKPYGITYRCEIFPAEWPDHLVASAEGYCGYDEPDREAHTKSFRNGGSKEVPRSPWNTIMQMAQKRAFVSATLRATASSGLFTQDVVDEPAAPAAPPDPDAYFKNIGWSSQAEHDEWRTETLASLKSLPDDKKALVRQWQESNGLDWRKAVEKELADVLDRYLDHLASPAGTTPAEAAQMPETALLCPGGCGHAPHDCRCEPTEF